MFQIAQDRLELFKKLYVSNAKNRLHELESPDINLHKRWIWELIQNAKNCSKEETYNVKNPENLSFVRKNQPVDIKIIYDQSRQVLIFMHNGFPFTTQTLDALMFKNSTKEKEDDNTGNFATGFMASHILSRVVPINGPFLINNQGTWELLYISATIYFEGNSERQIKQEFDKMEESKKFDRFDPSNEEHQWTKFTYQLTNEIAIQSANLGIQSFRDNIYQFLLFCDEINSIQFNDEEPIYISAVSASNNLYQTLIKQNIFKNIQVIEKTIEKKDDHIKERKFIIATIDDPNKQYSLKYSKDHEIEYIDKHLKYSIAFEIGSENSLVELEPNGICFFSNLPLIGSEKYQFPFIVCSPQFGTLAEGNGIILDENPVDANNILTNTGLNSLILNSSIELFRHILQWFIHSNCSKLVCFSHSLLFNDKTVPQMKPFLLKIREILENSKIVHNQDNVQIVFKKSFILDTSLPVEKSAEFFFLASQIYSNLVSIKECAQWKDKTWETISILNIDTFASHIEHIGKNPLFNPTTEKNSFQLSYKLFKNGLNPLQEDDFRFLMQLYAFLLSVESENANQPNSVFHKHSIILNSNNQFSSLPNLRTDKKCSEDFKKLLDLCTNPSWKSRIINPKVDLFNNFITDFTTNDALQVINSNLESNPNSIPFLLSFIRYTLPKNEHRAKMYRVAKLFYNVSDEVTLKGLDERLWSSVDICLLNKINELIFTERANKFTKSLDDLNIFYEMFQKFNPDSNFLVPNFDLDLIERNRLGFISNDIDPSVIEVFGSIIGLSQYAHPKITSVQFPKTYTLDNLIQTVNSRDFYYVGDDFLSGHLLSVLRIMPSKNNQQLYNHQSNIFKFALFFFCKDVSAGPTRITNPQFWQKADEVFLNVIATNLYTFESVVFLTKPLKKNENEILDYLNLYYEILVTDNNPQRKKNAPVPNYKGKFIKAENLLFSKGISEGLFDFYNLIHPGSDVRDTFAHPKIKCSFLRTIDTKQFITQITDSLTEEQLINDTTIIQGIRNLYYAYQSEIDILLQKLYVVNIKKSLINIKNPTENDIIRWPYEFIQNARDSLYSLSNPKQQKNVEIFISAKTDPRTRNCTEIKFSYNGLDFSENSFFNLLYKITQEKNIPDTTSFLSQILSNVVQINSNIDKNGTKHGFSVTLNREGRKDFDIVNDFKAMQNSVRTNLPHFPLTEFYYNINSEESKKCAYLGLQHLRDHISTLLINCPEIKFISIDENGLKAKYLASEPVISKASTISFFIYDIYEKSNLYQRFIVLNNNDNESRLNICVEINGKNEIVPIKDNMESLSIDFPLVGSSLHTLPFYLNSPEFESAPERNALLLNGNERINEHLTKTGINRLLLMKSTDLYANLITILKSISCSNIYELTRGLTLAKEPYKTFDMNWYKSSFLNRMREILSSNVSINSQSGETVLLKDAFIPSKRISKETLQPFISLAVRYYRNITDVNDAVNWMDRIWNELNIVAIEDLIYQAAGDSSLFDDPKLTYFNNLLYYISHTDIKLLNEYNIIPDMNNKLHCLSREIEKFDMKESRTVQGPIIDIMETIGIKWRSTHMNYSINSITLPEDKIADAENKIIEKTKNDKNMCFELMQFVLRNDKHRESMFNFVTELNIRDFNFTIVDNINPLIWKYADNVVLNFIISTIPKFSAEQVNSLIQFFKSFLLFYQDYRNDEVHLNSVQIYPNANCGIRKRTELRNIDVSFHNILNPMMIKCFNVDLNDHIFHLEINKYIKSQYNESFNDVITHVNENIDQLDEEKQLIAAETILSLFNQDESVESYKQEHLFNIYKGLINPNLNHVPIASYHFQQYKWEKSNNIIIEYICKKIDEAKTLNGLIHFPVNDLDTFFEYLNAFYPFATKLMNIYKIIPNHKGEFNHLKDLKQNPGLEDDLLECISYFKEKSMSMYDFADQRVQIYHMDKIDKFNFYRDLSSMFSVALSLKEVDNKVIEMIKKISNFDHLYDIIGTSLISEDQKERKKILVDSHVKFIKKRINELNTPKDKDFKIWPFELIKIANDSLNSNMQQQGNRVKIEFDLNDQTKVIFKYNGIQPLQLPFTNESLFTLLYQYTDIKRSGKYGTGFSSTHILSRTVKLTGDLQGKKGFSVTMFRNGHNYIELKHGVAQMERSFTKLNNYQNFTKFEFTLAGDKNSRDAYEKGLTSLENNIGPVLLFNPTIESITIKKNNESFVYSVNNIQGDIKEILLTENNINTRPVKRYIVQNTPTHNITCLLPINDDDQIMKVNNESLFISYPMLDDVKFESPLIINSPNFEPDNELNHIVFQSNDVPGESQESLTNKSIISKSADLLEQMLAIARQANNNNQNPDHSVEFVNICDGLNLSSFAHVLDDVFYNKMLNTFLYDIVFQEKRERRQILDRIICTDDDEEMKSKGKALVYEMLQNNDRFPVVNWHAYYDIAAEDIEHNQYYFIIKSTKNDDEYKKFSSKIQPDNFEFTDKLSEIRPEFILVFVTNVLQSPKVIFLTTE